MQSSDFRYKIDDQLLKYNALLIDQLNQQTVYKVVK